jgi:hypothetical protein
LYFDVPIYSDLHPFLERLLNNLPTPPDPNDRVLKISDAKKALSGACQRLRYHNFSQRNIAHAGLARESDPASGLIVAIVEKKSCGRSLLRSADRLSDSSQRRANLTLGIHVLKFHVWRSRFIAMRSYDESSRWPVNGTAVSA